MWRNTYEILLFIILSVALVACGSGETASNQEQNAEDGNVVETDIDIPDNEQGKSVGENPIVTIEMQDNEEIIIELYPDVAPNTVNNFISLIEDEFYDGLTFHRVIESFMIQGGDPNGDGTGDAGYTIAGEFKANDFPNNLKHDRGVISMARSSHPDSASSQFFITVEAAPHLDQEYAAFGEVIEGMEVVDQISEVETDEHDKPKEDQIINTIRVNTFDENFPEPKKLNE